MGLISCPEQQKPLEEKNFGTFWQIARVKEQIPLTFKHHDLERILARLQGLNLEKGQYGGGGWANYAASYFNDCYRFVTALKRILSHGGVGVIVVGNSILQGINIEVQNILGDIACMHGLNLEGIHRLRDKRVGDSITASSVRRSCAIPGARGIPSIQSVRNAVGRAALDESAVVIRKR